MSPSIPARGLLALIQLYKWTLSPLIGRECRYLPTCSSYAADAVRAHGAWAGSWMAGARLCRCHPWGGSGWDPAPEFKPRALWFAPWSYGDWSWRRRDPSPLVGEVSRHSSGHADCAAEPLGCLSGGTEGGRADTLAPDVFARPPPPAPAPQGGGGR